MANAAAKKQKLKNEVTIKNFQRISLIIYMFYLLIRVGVYNESFSYLHWGGLIFFTVIYLVTYNGIVSLAAVAYDTEGELTYGGADLAGKGIVEYYFDLVYLTWFVQVTTVWSDWFWLIYLVVPAFAVFKLWDFIGPYFFGGTKELPEDAKSKKSREKAEKKANKVKWIKSKR